MGVIERSYMDIVHKIDPALKQHYNKLLDELITMLQLKNESLQMTLDSMKEIKNGQKEIARERSPRTGFGTYGFRGY